MILNTLIQKGNWPIPMEPSADDQILASRLAKGDDSALSELNDRYGKRLYAYAFRLTGDSQKAEDVLQDVLITVCHSASRYRGEGRLIAWLLGIVHHTAMTSMRHDAVLIPEEIEESLAADHPSPEAQTQQKLQSEWVHEGLENLSVEHRAVLELMFYQGLSIEEIAHVCQCPTGTVKSRLAYARRHLKGVLSRHNLEEWK
jgi:RNA polymerase sigma-70 factor, ECF subfamily